MSIDDKTYFMCINDIELNEINEPVFGGLWVENSDCEKCQQKCLKHEKNPEITPYDINDKTSKIFTY